MKLIGCGDLHITDKVPGNRRKGYFQQVLNKFEQILKIACDTDEVLLIAGDIFDSANVSYDVTREVISLLKVYEIEIFVTFGQHDQRWHTTNLDNTPLGLLQEAGLIHVLSNKESVCVGDTSLIGAGWQQELEAEAEIIVTHRMITKKDPLWPGQTDYSTAQAIMRKYPWAKCILSGDNHLPHALRLKSKRLQINSGSMMRSNKSQINFKPRVYEIDTDTWTTKPIYLKIEKPEDVFDFEKIELEEIKKEIKDDAQEKISAFIATLPQNTQEKPNFSNVLQSIIKQLKPTKNVTEIINNTMTRISK